MATENIFTFRAVSMVGQIIEFQSQNPIEGMWSIIKADGYLQLADGSGKAARRIPFHAIADLFYIDPATTALAQATSPSMAKN